jgi:hypothetical protein
MPFLSGDPINVLEKGERGQVGKIPWLGVAMVRAPKLDSMLEKIG